MLDPGVVEFAGLLSQQQADAGYAGRLFAGVMDNYPFFPAEDVDGQVVLFFHFWNLRDGCWGINGLEVEAVQGRVLAWPVNMVCGRTES